jgi:hypothetical protein
MSSEAVPIHNTSSAPFAWGQTKVPWRLPESRLAIAVLLSLVLHGLLLTLQLDLAGLQWPDNLFREDRRGVEPALSIRLEPLPAQLDAGSADDAQTTPTPTPTAAFAQRPASQPPAPHLRAALAAEPPPP